MCPAQEEQDNGLLATLLELVTKVVYLSIIQSTDSFECLQAPMMLYTPGGHSRGCRIQPTEDTSSYLYNSVKYEYSPSSNGCSGSFHHPQKPWTSKDHLL